MSQEWGSMCTLEILGYFLGKMFTIKQRFRRDLATNFLGKNARVHVIIVLVNGKSDLKTKQISNNRTRWSCQQ